MEAPADGRRLDAFLAERLPEHSRARLQALIQNGRVAVSPPGRAAREARIQGPPAPGSAAGETPGQAPGRLRPSRRLRTGERVVVEIPAAVPTRLRPEAIPLDIVYEDAELLVIDKPPGLTVHPGAGRQTGTLVHAVLAHCPDLPGIGGEQRPGIVHRLDKDTSGLIIVAKTEAALRALQTQIQARRIKREYVALVHGSVAQAEGTIDAPVGRDPRHRTRMAIVESGRRAVTHFRVAGRFRTATLLELRLDTGRTHQIRVHCASIGHPVVGDAVYARRPNPWGLRRQALHAYQLEFTHPASGADLRFSAPLPGDMEAALRLLRPPAGRLSEAGPA